MALYDQNTFESLYNDASAGKPFQTNTVRAIVSSIMRAFSKDISDSFVYKLNGTNTDLYSLESYDWLWNTLSPLPMGWDTIKIGTNTLVASGNYGSNTTERAIGTVQIGTGTTAAGLAAIWKPFIGFGILPLRFRMRNALQSLSSGTDRFTIHAGYTDNVGVTGEPATGVYFRYVDNVNGGKWQAVTRNLSTETAVDTGVAATTQYSIFDISVNDAGTVATFQIDNNAPVTISTNIPAPAANSLALVYRIEKSIGANAIFIHQDWYSHLISSTTAR